MRKLIVLLFALVAVGAMSAVASAANGGIMPFVYSSSR